MKIKKDLAQVVHRGAGIMQRRKRYVRRIGQARQQRLSATRLRSTITYAGGR